MSRTPSYGERYPKRRHAVFAEVWRGGGKIEAAPDSRVNPAYLRGARGVGGRCCSAVWRCARICRRMTTARDMEPVAEPAGPLSSPEQLLPASGMWRPPLDRLCHAKPRRFGLASLAFPRARSLEAILLISRREGFTLA